MILHLIQLHVTIQGELRVPQGGLGHFPAPSDRSRNLKTMTRIIRSFLGVCLYSLSYSEKTISISTDPPLPIRIFSKILYWDLRFWYKFTQNSSVRPWSEYNKMESGPSRPLVVLFRVCSQHKRFCTFVSFLFQKEGRFHLPASRSARVSVDGLNPGGICGSVVPRSDGCGSWPWTPPGNPQGTRRTSRPPNPGEAVCRRRDAEPTVVLHREVNNFVLYFFPVRFCLQFLPLEV